MANNAKTPSAPISRHQYGSITASVFGKNVESKAGNAATVYNVSLTRPYTDAKGDLQYTASLRYEDLLPAAHALAQAYEQITRERSSGDA